MHTPLSQFAGQYREWTPAAGLRDHVSRLWVNDLSHSSATNFYVVPDGSVDIFWTGHELCVAGPDTRPILEAVRPGFIVSGLRFHPGAANLWLGVPLSEIRNARVPLKEFWKRDACLLSDLLSAAPDPSAATITLEQALLRRIAQVGQADRRVAFLRRAAGLHTGAGLTLIREVTKNVGMSERTLRRYCTDVFGYGFKTLQRILRFQNLFRLMAFDSRANLAELAIVAGFADQAHMSREVRRLCQATPAELIAQILR